MGLSLLATTDTQIIRVIEALYNQRPGYTYLSNYRTFVTENSIEGFANSLAANFASSTDAELAATVTANLGLTGDALTGGNAYLEGQFAAAPAARGAAILDAMNLLATLESDATFGAIATSFNADVASSSTYSQNSANTAVVTSDASVAVVTGSAFGLTSSADVLSPTAATAANVTSVGDDTVRGMTDGELTSSDIINMGDGADTLTARIDNGTAAETVQPILTSVETVNVTFGSNHGNDLLGTLNLTDATGVTTVVATLEDDVNASVAALTDQAVTFKAGGATAKMTAAYTGLSTATDGGADAKTLSLSNIDVTTMTVAGVETLTLNVSGTAGDIDTVVAAALEAVVITGGVEDATVTTETFALGTTSGSADNSAIDFDGLDTGETASIDASTSTGDLALVVDDSVNLTATGGAGVLTIANTSAGNGAVSGTATVSVTAGAGGVKATLEGGANLSSATAMATITVTGSAVADTVNVAGAIDPTDITATTGTNEAQTVNVTIAAGEGDNIITIDAGVVALTAGAGDDTLTVTTQGSVDQYDSIDLGAGTDTVVTSEAALNSSDATWMGYFTGAEVIKTSATAEKTIDMGGLTTVTSAVALAHAATAAGSGTDSAASTETEATGTAGITFTSSNTNNTLTVSDVTGGQGEQLTAAHNDAGDTGGLGGVGLDLNATLDTGSNVVNLIMEDDADITGGEGGDSAHTNATAGDGAMAIDANEYESVNIVLAAKDTTADTVTLAGGIAGDSTTGDAGTASAIGITVGNNATITVTETLAATSGSTTLTIADHISSIDFNTITGDNVTVDASTLNGDVTIDAVAGNATITTGAGDDTILAGAGTDTISVGAGDDTVNGQAGGDLITVGLGNDVITLDATESTTSAYEQITGFSLASASWTGSSANNGADEVQSTGVAGADADILDIGSANTLDVAGLSGTLGTTATSNVEVSALGKVTFATADDTLAERLTALAADTTDITAGETVFFEQGSDTFIFHNDATDMLVKLVGVTGATGMDLTATSGTVGGDGYIIIA